MGPRPTQGFEAKDSAPQHAGFLLLQIRYLYRLEAKLRRSHAEPRLRQTLRASHSRTVVERIARTLRHLQHRRCHLPQSAMGKAISYTLNLLAQLEVYLNDGCIHIDNNPVENAIRPTAIGKKNWLFIGEARPASAAPSSTPSSNPTAPTASIPSNSCTPFSPDSPP